MDSFFNCAFCFQQNSIFVDASAGSAQQYIEDCQVCCRPNVLHIQWDDGEQGYCVSSEPEGGGW